MTARSRKCAAAAALAYLLIAGWWLRDVLREPGSRVPGAARGPRVEALVEADQQMVVSVLSRHARLLATRPAALATEGHCFPTPWSYTLGDHMFGHALLAVVPIALTGDPIVSYNVVLLASSWIAAMAMYALSFYFTRSPPAAFVAGLLFAFSCTRLSDPVHPYVAGGDLWAPLALLFLHRLFAERTWRSALGFAVFFSLLLGESLYALLSASILIAVFALRLAARDPRRLRAIAPQLVVAGVVIGAVAWLVFAPYLHTAATWDLMRRDAATFAQPSDFAPGHRFFPGTVVMLLAAVALIDRARGARSPRGDDPRLVLLAAGLLIVWCSIGALPILGSTIPSPLLLLREHVPGLAAVRVLAAVRIGAYLVAAFLAGYGVLALMEVAGRRGRLVVAATLSMLALLEIALPGFATFSFGRPIPVGSRSFRPSESDIDLAVRTATGAVLDLPHTKGYLAAYAEQLLLSAYHQHPSSACYNSFATPVQTQVGRLALALPSRHAVDALAALGFRTVLVHRSRMRVAQNQRVPKVLARAATRPDSGITWLGSSDGIDAYRLAAPATVHSDLGALREGAIADVAPTTETMVGPPRAIISFAIANDHDATFVHPEPVAPSDLVATWRTPGGQDARSERIRALLPLAIARRAMGRGGGGLGGARPPGGEEVTLARALAPAAPLARASVRVAPTDPS